MDIAIKRNETLLLSFLNRIRVQNLEKLLSDLFYSKPETAMLIEKQGDLILL